MKIRWYSIALALALIPYGAAAQSHAWDVPSFFGPRQGDDIGLYISEIADFGIQGIWRQTGNLNLGLRLGYIDTSPEGQLAVGAESWGRLVEAGESLPVDVTWTAGAGATFNGGTTLEIPVGLSIGRTVDLGGLAVQFYGHPRFALFVHGDDGRGDGDTDLDVLFDLGADMALNESWRLRLGAAFGAADTIGFGFAYRWTRGAVVR